LVTLTLCGLLLFTVILGGGASAAASQYGDGGGFGFLFGASLLPLLCIGPIFLLIGGGITIVLPNLLHRYAKRTYQQKLGLWERAMSRYESLYYCARDAGVFMPGQARLVPMEHMQAFLFEIQATEPTWPSG
jgi:hypothetical protein